MTSINPFMSPPPPLPSVDTPLPDAMNPPKTQQPPVRPLNLPLPAFHTQPLVPPMYFPPPCLTMNPTERAKLQLASGDLPNPYLYTPLSPTLPYGAPNEQMNVRAYPPLVHPYFDGKAWPYLPLNVNGQVFPVPAGPYGMLLPQRFLPFMKIQQPSCEFKWNAALKL